MNRTRHTYRTALAAVILLAVLVLAGLEAVAQLPVRTRDLRLYSNNNTNYTSVQAVNGQTANWSLLLPPTEGSTGSLLTSAVSGSTATMSWLAPGTNGQILTINAGVPSWQGLNGTAWLLAGNSGTTPASQFIGTTDAVDFVARTNNLERLRILSGGQVGIGITAPTEQLSIRTDDAAAAAITSVATLGHSTTGTPANGLGAGLLFRLESSTTDNQDAARISAVWTTVTHATRAAALTFQTVNAGGALTERMRLNAAGGLGIGITAVAGFNLHVAGTAGTANVRLASLGGNAVATAYVPAATDGLITANTNGDLVKRSFSAALNSSAWLVGGNTLGAAGSIGTNDAFDVNIETNNTTRLTISSAGAITQTGTGLVTLTGNVDATNGLDVTGANLTVGATNFTVAPATGNTSIAGTIGVAGTSTLGSGAGSNVILANTTGSVSVLGTVGTPNVTIASVGGTAAATVPVGYDRVLITDNTGLVNQASFGAVLASGAWTLTGNTGTNPATNFLGTTDAQPLVIRTDNTERLRVLATGEVGIGVTAPANSLEVVGSFLNTFNANDAFGGAYSSVVTNNGTALSVASTAPPGPNIRFFGQQFTTGTFAAESGFLFNNNDGTRLYPSYTTFVEANAGGYVQQNLNGGAFNPNYALRVEGATVNDYSIFTASQTSQTLRTTDGTQNAQLTLDLGDVELAYSAANATNAVVELTPNGSGDVVIRFRTELGSYDFPRSDGLANTVLTTDGGGNLSWQSPAATAWALLGNASTDPNVNFLGTTDAQPLVIRTDDIERMRILETGLVGIGTATPAENLSIGIGSTDQTLGMDVGPDGNASFFFKYAGVIRGLIQYSDSDLLLQNVATGTAGRIVLNTAGPNEEVYITSTGIVAINESSPVNNMHVTVNTATTALATALALDHSSTGPGTGLGTALLYRGETSGGSREMAQIASVWTDGADATRSAALTFSTVNNAASLTERLRINSTGEVGIGLTAAPGYALHVAGTAATPNVRLASVGGLANTAALGANTGVLVADANGDIVKRSFANIADSIGATSFWNLNGNNTSTAWNGTTGTRLGTTSALPLVLATTNATAQDIRFFTGASGANERMRILGTGEIGIGATAPTTGHMLTIASVPATAGVGLNIDLTGTTTSSGVTIRNIGNNGGNDAGIVLGTTSNGTGTAMRIGSVAGFNDPGVGIEIEASSNGITYQSTNTGSGIGFRSGVTATRPRIGIEAFSRGTSGADAVAVRGNANATTAGNGIAGHFLTEGTTGNLWPLIVSSGNNNDVYLGSSAADVPASLSTIVGTTNANTTFMNNAQLSGTILQRGNAQIANAAGSTASIGNATGTITLSGTAATPNITMTSVGGTANATVPVGYDRALVANASGLVSQASFSAILASGAWTLTGNAGTNPATNFLGTTDAQPLAIRTNNVERLRVNSTGEVGIGTTAAAGYSLHVGGTAGTPNVRLASVGGAASAAAWTPTANDGIITADNNGDLVKRSTATVLSAALNPLSGQVTLTAGATSVVINNTNVVANSRILVTYEDANAAGFVATMVTTKVVGTSFTVAFSGPIPTAAAGRLNYLIINP
jgi:hypothetical protein